jgi:hypothetical protein
MLRGLTFEERIGVSIGSLTLFGGILYYRESGDAWSIIVGSFALSTTAVSYMWRRHQHRRGLAGRDDEPFLRQSLLGACGAIVGLFSVSLGLLLASLYSKATIDRIVYGVFAGIFAVFLSASIYALVRFRAR